MRVLNLEFGDTVYTQVGEILLFIGRGPHPDLVGIDQVTYWDIKQAGFSFRDQYPETEIGTRVKATADSVSVLNNIFRSFGGEW